MKNGYGLEGAFQGAVLHSDLAIETVAYPKSVQGGRDERRYVGR